VFSVATEIAAGAGLRLATGGGAVTGTEGAGTGGALADEWVALPLTTTNVRPAATTMSRARPALGAR
jgi:hypothetical protein